MICKAVRIEWVSRGVANLTGLAQGIVDGRQTSGGNFPRFKLGVEASRPGSHATRACHVAARGLLVDSHGTSLNQESLLTARMVRQSKVSGPLLPVDRAHGRGPWERERYWALSGGL